MVLDSIIDSVFGDSIRMREYVHIKCDGLVDAEVRHFYVFKSLCFGEEYYFNSFDRVKRLADLRRVQYKPAGVLSFPKGSKIKEVIIPILGPNNKSINLILLDDLPDLIVNAAAKTWFDKTGLVKNNIMLCVYEGNIFGYYFMRSDSAKQELKGFNDESRVFLIIKPYEKRLNSEEELVEELEIIAEKEKDALLYNKLISKLLPQNL